MSSVLASNAGDQYHFVYTARRMLDMLHPRSELELIAMENVAREDLRLAESPETFLGVDLTEYYAGKNSKEASRIVIVQVKYSPTNPTGTWTLNQLCQNKIGSRGRERPGTSVLRKLSNAFDALYSELGEVARDRLSVKLFANQYMPDDLHAQLLQTKNLLTGSTGREGSQLLHNTTGEQRQTLDRLQQVTKLSWKRLSTEVHP